jgi:hypothetical protein
MVRLSRLQVLNISPSQLSHLSLVKGRKDTSDIITQGIPPIPSENDPVKIWVAYDKNI